MNLDNVVWSKSKTWFLIIILPSSISLLNPEIYVYCYLVFCGPLFLFASVLSLFLFELRLLITPFFISSNISYNYYKWNPINISWQVLCMEEVKLTISKHLVWLLVCVFLIILKLVECVVIGILISNVRYEFGIEKKRLSVHHFHLMVGIALYLPFCRAPLNCRLRVVSHPFLAHLAKSSPLKPLGQMNRNLVGSILGRSSIKTAHLVPIR